jgi:hypothetical protein
MVFITTFRRPDFARRGYDISVNGDGTFHISKQTIPRFIDNGNHLDQRFATHVDYQPLMSGGDFVNQLQAISRELGNVNVHGIFQLFLGGKHVDSHRPR